MGKLATEMTALALTDAGLREAAGHSRTGMIIASTAPGLGDLVSSQLGFAASGPYPAAARTSSLHAVTAAAAAPQAGELDLAIAGGAELGLDPVWLTLQARAGTLGTDEMRVYAADSAGLLPGAAAGLHHHRQPGHPRGRPGLAAGRAGNPAGAVRPGDGASGARG